MTTTDGGVTWTPQTLNNGNYLSGVYCQSTTICLADGALGSMFVTSGTVTNWQRQQTGTQQDLFAVTCGNFDCYAVGVGGIWNSSTMWSADGGGNNIYFSVACGGSVCAAVGYAGATAVLNGTTTWYSTGSTGASVTLHGVTCPVGQCYAAGADGNVYVGLIAIDQTPAAGWIEKWGHGSVGEPGALNTVSCTSTTTCFAAGDYGFIATTTTGATGWTQPVGPESYAMYGVTCPSATSCTAVGDGGVMAWSNNGGGTWAAGNWPGVSLLSVACPSVTQCVLVGTGGVILKNAGAFSASAAQPSNTTDNLQGVACPSTTVCYVVTSRGSWLVSSDGGSTWTSSVVVPNGSLSGLSCPTVTTCFVTDGTGRVLKTSNGGGSWSVNFDLAGDFQAGTTGPFDSIACPTTTICYAAGGSGLVATTLDGVNWRTDNTPSTTASLFGLSCPTINQCFVASGDSTIIETTDSGGTWTAGFGGAPAIYQGVFCFSGTSCLAVGSAGTISKTTTAGAAWTRLQPSGSITSLRRIACTDANNCYATAWDGQNPGGIQVTHDGGATWMLHALNNADSAGAVSCPAANTCFASGWPGAIYFTANGGTTWTYQSNPVSGADQTLSGISCPTVTSCYVVGTQGTILSTTNEGSTWQRETAATTAQFFGVSCDTTGSCVAVGTNGVSFTRSAGTWQSYATGVTGSLNAISCSGPATCYAVGRSAQILKTTNLGVSWTAQSSGLVTTLNLLGVRCVEVNVCLATSGYGRLIYTTDGTNWSPAPTPTFSTLRDVEFVGGHTWVVGTGGTILENSNLLNVCLRASASADKSSPQAIGAPVTFTASSTTCTSPQYEFWLQDPSGNWTLKQTYGGASTWTWDTRGAALGTYTIHAWAEESGDNPNSYESIGEIKFTLVPTPPCTGASVAPASSTQPGGSSVNFTASSTGCTTPEYEFWVQYPDSTWHLLQGFGGPALAWNTSGLTPGLYTIHVWVNNQGTGYDAIGSATVTLTGCTSASLSPSSSSQPAGTTVALTASSTGCASPRYAFWVQYPDLSWHFVQDFGGPTLSWNTAGLTPGTYTVHVWVNQQGNGYDAVGSATLTLTGCSAATLSPATPSQAAGTTFSFTASSTGCLNPRYAFWVQYPNGSWYFLQDFGGPSFSWNTGGLAPGTYNVHVWVNTQGNGYDSVGSATATLTGCTAAALSPASASSPAGTNITFTASATGCANPTFEFWLQDPGGTWHFMRAYSTTATWSWNSTGWAKGAYTVHVWANQQGADMSTYEAIGSATFTLT